MVRTAAHRTPLSRALRNVVRIITETGLRRLQGVDAHDKGQVDLANSVLWIPDSKHTSGVAELPHAMPFSAAGSDGDRGKQSLSFPSEKSATGSQRSLRTAWRLTLRRAKIPYFRIYDLRSTYATRLSAGGVADEWVTNYFVRATRKSSKKYSQ